MKNFYKKYKHEIKSIIKIILNLLATFVICTTILGLVVIILYKSDFIYTNINSGYDKPVLYLYTEEETDIEIKLDLGENGKLTTTYPKYNDGWKVKAYPDGTIVTNDMEYNYIYWEGESDYTFDRSKGFCIAGENTEKFLEETLAILGLNRKEANEFIVYWLPLMENNKYNYITFHTQEYADKIKLDINPIPDNQLRIYMITEKLEEYIEVEPQILDTNFKREGFTIVEWGGGQIIK